ncbi:MAG: RagB/SusD family nutrient uptake outer membrane protein, partial [Sphingobacteriales bacterium]
TNSTERIRPNKWAATALLARTYLYNGDWTNAEIQATALIDNTGMYSLSTLNTVFLKNNNEVIWQLQTLSTQWNTDMGRIFILPPTGPSNSSFLDNPVYLSERLVNNFEAGDQRKTEWIKSVTVVGTTYYYAYKYKSATLNAPVTEYYTVFRLGEQYLIRAEARAQLGKLTASDDINAIRSRAGLDNYSGSTDKTALLNAIAHERQIEMFTEWGDRWFDLKRTGKIDAVMTVVAPLKNTTWNTNLQLDPIPLYEIIQDPNIIQNPGY